MDWKNLNEVRNNVETVKKCKRTVEHLKSIQTTPQYLGIQFTSQLNSDDVEINPKLDLKLHIQLCKILQQHYTDQINRIKANLAGLGVTNYE